MEWIKNKHFKTVVALDFNEKALKHLKIICQIQTIIVGDITNDK